MRENDPKRSSFQLSATPGNLLRRNHQRSFEIFSKAVGSDVTRQQIALLIAVDQQPGASQSALVEATGIDKSTLKEMIGRLSRSGWIKQERDPADGRAWKIYLGPRGDDILRDRIDLIIAAQEEILAPLAPELRPIFLRCLRILIGLEPPAE